MVDFSGRSPRAGLAGWKAAKRYTTKRVLHGKLRRQIEAIPREWIGAPLVAFDAISKRFPGVLALREVSFQVAGGRAMPWWVRTVRARVRWGRSWLGFVALTKGTSKLKAAPAGFILRATAQRAGIGLVHQELSYCPNLSVAENLCLSSLPHRGLLLDRKAMVERTKRFLDAVGADCGPDEELGRLTTGQIQLVQIAAALATGARVLVLDEPTSSLSLAAARKLESLIGQLQRQGTTILYVSHRMEEIFRLCDTATVLRDGQHVATLPLAQTSEDELVRLMIGRSLAAYFPTHVGHSPGGERLRVEGLSSPGRFHDVTFGLRSGEVLGMAGLVGSGRSEVAQAIVGMDPGVTGRLLVDGTAVTIRSPRQALSQGIGLVTEDRKRFGIVPDMSCGENLTLSVLDCLGGRGLWARAVHCPWCPKREDCLRFWDWLRLARERALVMDYFGRLRVRAASPAVPIATLSGGNQQKVVLAKCLARRCRVLMLDEPTRGVDVGAKAEIHRLIDELASAGQAVLMISSELPEILHLSTRVLVMRQGRVVGLVNRAEATQEKIMQLMAGRTNSPDALEANRSCQLRPPLNREPSRGRPGRAHAAAF